MACWSTSAIRRRTRTTPSGPCGRGWISSTAIAPLKAQLAADKGLRLAVRLGIHTGLVVVGAMGTRGRQESLAVGDTPNITARLQGLAAPDTVVISDATWRLVQGYFACLVYQRGVPPQATYTFKHALIQDAAYQSLLRSTRQQYHQRLAQVLAERFPEMIETQPELLAHHYTEAGLSALAVVYWQRAGKRASERSAYVEAISHLRKGLAVLQMLPDTPSTSAARTGVADHAWPGVDCYQGVWGSGSGTGLHPGAGAMSADGGDAGRVPCPAGTVGLS